MGLTVYQQPQELTPAYNDQIFTALSTGIANSDFKYIVQVTVNGDTANIYTEDILQRPDGYLVFNAIQWVKNYIEHYFELDNVVLANPINLATNKSVSVVVNISDFWGGTPQTSLGFNYVAFDACLTDSEFRSYDFNDYIFNATAGLYFLSKTTSTILPDNRIALNQPLFYHFINSTTTPIDSINIKLYRGITLIETVNIATIPTAVTAHDIYQLYLGSQIFTLGAQVGDTVTVKFYDGAVVLLDMELTYQSICTKYQDYVIYYLDRDGNVLSFHFEQKSKKNSTKSINSVRLDKNVLNTTTGAYGSHTYDREQHIISTVTENTLELNTDWLSQTQATQLKDLFDSPIVYIWDYNNLRSCKVTNLNFEEYQINNEPLNVLNITVDLGISETRQRGI